MNTIIEKPLAAPMPALNQTTAALHDASVKLEASFLAEMLNAAGLGKTRGSFGGGAGEDQFGSFLVRAQAEQIARSGGIGLAETLFRSLSGGHDAI